MAKYSIDVIMTGWTTMEIEADSLEEANNIALDKVDFSDIKEWSVEIND